ncbi:MAG: hypothetical protein SH817_06865 [Leptospira sp.]|nr:hypothetical protein [Leptospira sp.]
MKFNIILFSLILSLTFTCSDLKAPIYKGKNHKQISNEWKFILLDVGKIGTVNGSWFGDDFYSIEFGIENQTDFYRFLKFFNQKMDKVNLLASLKSDPKLVGIFQVRKDLFIFNDFTNPYEGISIYFSLPMYADAPNTVYDKKLVFPAVTTESNRYKVAFVASDFGIPMSNPLVNESPTSTGWMEPGEYRKFKLYFSVPRGAKLEKVIFPDVFEAELVEK